MVETVEPAITGTEFGLPLEELFQMSDALTAPSVVIQCTTELEKRTRETGWLESATSLCCLYSCTIFLHLLIFH